MPGVVMDEIHEVGEIKELKENGNSTPCKENEEGGLAPRNGGEEHVGDGVVEPSIEELYENVCEMQSSDQSPSRHSFGSDGDESRIDSELRHLVGGEMREVEIIEEDEEVQKPETEDSRSDSGSKKETSDDVKLDNSPSSSMKDPSSGQPKTPSQLVLESETSAKSNTKGRRASLDKKNGNNTKKVVVGGISRSRQKSSPASGSKLKNGTEDSSDSGLDNPDLGPFLLKQARDLIASGDNSHKALELAHRAAKSFEKCANGKPSLDVVMCLHVTAAIYCNLGQYDDAIPLIEHSLEIPVVEEGQEHALAKFAGYMQLGDTYAMLGQLENSIVSYTTGMEIQRQVLGDSDPRVGETCRYLAEAHVQALQFDEAEKLCWMALDIHKENGSPPSLEEAADRRLMGLICESKGDHEAALEHLVLASMAMVANGQESEVASVDCSIGDTYLSLNRYDEAIFAYQKALTALKSSKGENHPAVASVFVRLADLYNRTGKLRDSKSYCENALRIYGKPIPGIAPEEIANGLTDVSAIYESMNELDQALKLLQKALKIYNNAPGQQSTIAGIEAQMGVIYYMLGKYSESYNSFKSAISKLRASGEKKSAFFGVALNQMGLACVQRYAINEAVELFEESKGILEQEYGPYHPETLGVYSNLAGTYDAVGRLDEAIEILEYIVGVREEKLGTANPDVADEKKRLAELLKEAATTSQPAAKDNHDANPEATRENSPASVFVNSEPVREEQVENAVKFLSHPRVRGSPVMYRRSFLERKGLTKEEIDEAFCRVPDPTPTVSTTQPVASNEVKSSSTTQALSASQNLQSASAQQSNTMRKMGYFSHFHWTHAVMAASGAGTALLLKHTIIPRFKSWIRKVVMEEEDEKGTLKGRPSLAEEAAVAAKAAAAAAVDVARASQEMLASKTEEKRYFEELTNLLNYQVREMKSMSSALQKLEGKSSTSGRIPAMERDDKRVLISHSTDINDQPPNPYQPVPNPHVGPKPKPWEIGQNQNSSRSFLQSQGSGDGLNYEYQDSSTPWWQRKSGRITVTEAENKEKFGYTPAPTEVRPVQRSWVPPQPPPVAMAEAAAAIRQPKKPLFQKEKLTGDELKARSSEISDDVQRITTITESGGLTETNGSSFGQQLSEAPITNGDNVLNS